MARGRGKQQKPPYNPASFFLAAFAAFFTSAGAVPPRLWRLLAEAAGGKWSTFVIWAKNTFTLGRSDYQRQYEPILYGWKQGTDHFWCGARDQGDVWFVNKPTKNDLHPTMKPIELVERAIRNSSKSRDIVLDCFGGSGIGKTAISWMKQNVWQNRLHIRIDVLVGNRSGLAFWRAAGFQDYLKMF